MYAFRLFIFHLSRSHGEKIIHCTEGYSFSNSLLHMEVMALKEYEVIKKVYVLYFYFKMLYILIYFNYVIYMKDR